MVLTDKMIRCPLVMYAALNRIKNTPGRGFATGWTGMDMSLGPIKNFLRSLSLAMAALILTCL